MHDVCVLTYHSIDDSGSAVSISPEEFAAHMEVLAQLNVHVVPLGEIVGEAQQAVRERPAVAITFDDGFSSVMERAVPVLQRHGFDATVFVVTDYCGRTNRWPSQQVPLDFPLMTWDQLRVARRCGLELAAHTRTHPYLTLLSSSEVEAEMAESRSRLEEEIGAPVRAFAYPYGSVNAEVQACAARHFDLACGTRLDYLGPGASRFALERLDAYYFRSPGAFRRIFTPLGRTYVRGRRFLRECRRWLGGASPGGLRA